MSSSLARRRQNLKDGSGSIEIEKMESLFWPNPSRKILKKPTKIDKAYKNKQQEHAIDYYDKIFDCIVKIYATHNKEPDPTMPWQKNHSYTSTSTGFVISTQTGDGKQKQKILTNAHSVQYAGQILVRKRGSSKKFRASIQIIANECDLALLTINDDSFWYSYKEEGEDDDNDYEYGGDYDHNDEIDGEKDQDELGDEDKDEDEYTNSKGVITTKPLEFGVLPELQDEVEVIGYPTGGDELSVTRGVVSRVEATEYAQCSGSYLLAIQIDAAINGGNSGGPVVDSQNKNVIGVAFQTLNDAENIGYVIPVTVVQHFLEDVKRNNYEYYSGVTSLGVSYAKLENPSLRKYLKIPSTTNEAKKKNKQKHSETTNEAKHVYNDRGVVVRSCYPTSFAKDILQSNDVILSIDGIHVSSDGNIPFRRNGRERVTFASYIQTKFKNDVVKLNIWRNGSLLEGVEVPLCISSKNKLVPSHWQNTNPPYLIVGGLVFTVLSIPYLDEHDAWGDFISENISYLLNKIYEPIPERQVKEKDQETQLEQLPKDEKPINNKPTKDNSNGSRLHEQHNHQDIVVLINVLAHPNNIGYDEKSNLHLVSCNDVKVKSLQHLHKMILEIEEQQDTGDVSNIDEFIKFEFASNTGSSGGQVVVMETSTLRETTLEVCEEHSIQKPYYFPPIMN